MGRFALFCAVGLCLVLSGCALPVLPAVVASAGGAVAWQHGKIVSDEPRNLEEVQKASEEALRAGDIEVNDLVKRDNFVQLRGVDPQGQKVAVDLVDAGEGSTHIEVRVGVGKRKEARAILLEIKDRLYKNKKLKFF